MLYKHSPTSKSLQTSTLEHPHVIGFHKETSGGSGFRGSECLLPWIAKPDPVWPFAVVAVFGGTIVSENKCPINSSYLFFAVLSRCRNTELIPGPISALVFKPCFAQCQPGWVAKITELIPVGFFCCNFAVMKLQRQVFILVTIVLPEILNIDIWWESLGKKEQLTGSRICGSKTKRIPASNGDSYK